MFDILCLEIRFSDSDGEVWVGGSDSDVEGIWRWSADDSVLDFTVWYTNQPDNNGGNGDCMAIITNWDNNWDDMECLLKREFFCQNKTTTKTTTTTEGTETTISTSKKQTTKCTCTYVYRFSIKRTFN